MAGLNFNAATVAPSETFEPLPAGWYAMMIDQSEMKPTKDGSGSYLECRLTVVEGQYVNRKVFIRLNLNNKSQQAQEIAYRELSAICHATGVMQVNDSAQLHAIPMKVKLKVRAATAQYEATNEVSGYKNVNDPTAVNPAGAAPVPGTAAPTGFAPPAQPAFATAQPAHGFAASPSAPSAGYQPVAPAAHAAAPAWTPPAGAAAFTPAQTTFQPAATAPAAASAAPAAPAEHHAHHAAVAPAQAAVATAPVAAGDAAAASAPVDAGAAAAAASATPPWAQAAHAAHHAQ